MTCRARYAIAKDRETLLDPLMIKDLGPWDKHPTITNDVEAVVDDLVRQGLLPEGRRLFYYDSEGNRDEILVVGGKFAGFKPGPGR